MSVATISGAWRETTLGEIGEYVNGRGFKKSEWSDRGRMIVRIQDLTGSGNSPNYFDGECDEKHVVRQGDLLVSWAATLDAFVWHGSEAVLNQHIFKVQSSVDRRLHFHLIKFVLEDIRRRAHGSGMVHITKGEFEQTRVHIPDSRQEQAAVADAIDEQLSRLDFANHAIARASQELVRYREAAISWAISAHRAGQIQSDGDRPAVPDHWRWVALGDVSRVAGGVTKDQKRTVRPGFLEVPYLRVANVQRGFLDLRDVRTISASPKEVAELRLQPGDILFNEGGDRDKLGRGWVWEGQLDPCIHQNHVFRARLSTEDLDPRFVSWYANTLGRGYFLRQGKQTTNLASINRTQLTHLPVPVPPRDEQDQIVKDVERQLSVLDELRSEVGIAAKRAANLRQAILSQLLGGQAAFDTAESRLR